MKTQILRDPTDSDLKLAAAILQRGGLVAFPTETVYGLGASALDADAAAKIFAAKGRPSDNPLILHLAHPQDAEKYAQITPCYQKLASLFMPGPLTVILEKKNVVPSSVTGGLPTVAIRVPAHPIAHKLIEYSALPIAAPSANLSGKPSCTTAEHVIADMNGRIDVILDGGASDFGLESTILLPTGEREVKVLRPGAITVEMLVENGFIVSLDKAVTEKLKDDEKPLAPGMKYRHYAPRAQVILLDGSPDRILAYMKGCSKDPSIAFICYEEALPFLETPNVLSIGSENDARMCAHRLFATLRTFDERNAIATILAPLPSKADIGLALYNRMLKAAGYTVLKV